MALDSEAGKSQQRWADLLPSTSPPPPPRGGGGGGITAAVVHIGSGAPANSSQGSTGCRTGRPNKGSSVNLVSNIKKLHGFRISTLLTLTSTKESPVPSLPTTLALLGLRFKPSQGRYSVNTDSASANHNFEVVGQGLGAEGVSSLPDEGVDLDSSSHKTRNVPWGGYPCGSR